MARPKTGGTPVRHVRVAGSIWDEVQRIAREDGRTQTGIVVEALTRWLAWHKRKGRHSAGS